ncbi:MAG: hypothetical protein ACK56Q_08035, partial [Pirellulaceae bacterium]
MFSTMSRAMFLGLTIHLFPWIQIGQQPVSAEQPGSTQLYFGGDILTMRGPKAEYAESLVVRDGKILFVGELAEAEKQAGSSPTRIDLDGKTLLPGFIDTHGHFV